MAQKVLNSEISSLVNAMKLALKYNKTVLDAKYTRDMLQAGHAVAVESKNLLETVDTARRVKIYLQQIGEQHSKPAETQDLENGAQLEVQSTAENLVSSPELQQAENL
jgi:focal adhesion kinase 1